MFPLLQVWGCWVMVHNAGENENNTLQISRPQGRQNGRPWMLLTFFALCMYLKFFRKAYIFVFTDDLYNNPPYFFKSYNSFCSCIIPILSNHVHSILSLSNILNVCFLSNHHSFPCYPFVDCSSLSNSLLKKRLMGKIFFQF